MSRKQRRRARKRNPERKPVSPDRLLEHARQSLNAGDPRRALELLRRVQHQDPTRAGLPLWLFCACVERARQLTQKGMAKEAIAMRSRALQHRVAICVRSLSEESLGRYLRCLDGAETLSAYADYLARGPALPAAERAVADSLVISRCWEQLALLAADHSLRQDAVHVRGSLDAMDSGDWKRAASLLAGVSRRSPFAPWRLFCKAMACFAAGDDRGLQRALDLLPQDFALRGTVAELTRCAAGGTQKGQSAIEQALGTGQAASVTARADRLRLALHRGNEREIERHVVSLASLVYPSDHVRARIDLLLIAALAVVGGSVPGSAMAAMVGRIVPASRFRGVMAQVSLLVQETTSGRTWHPEAAAVYLEELPAEFPRPTDQALARSCVLESLARTGHQAGVGTFSYDPEWEAPLAALLGRPPEDAGMVLVDLMMASLDADPESGAGYRFLLELLRGSSPAAGPRLSGILEELAERYPDTPEPWLELATRHYARGAYRRAEAALGEARRRAPYDNRVLDLQAIGFLKSADQSRKRGRYALAARDLERAADLRRPRLKPLLRVKRLLLDVVEEGTDVALRAAPHLEPLAPGAQLRTLVVAIHDLEENLHLKNVDPGMVRALRQFLTGAAAAIERLDPDEVLELVTDLPADYRILYDSLRVAPVLNKWWGALMARLDGDRLIACFDTLLACDGQVKVRAELERRLRRRRGWPLLQFYLAVIRYEDGDDRGAASFTEILEDADSTERERLRAAAHRLAQVVEDEPLRHALQQFDFDILDRVASPLASLWDLLAGLPVPEDDHPIVPAEHEAEPKAVSGSEFPVALHRAARSGLLDPAQGRLFEDETVAVVLDRLEAMIDSADLRSIRLEYRREIFDSVRTDPETRRMLDEIADRCTATNRRTMLSSELDALLFPVPDAVDADKELF